ncbi:MAG: cyclic nucleotide-binding domain-containing protein [Desulfosarcina sp.]
MKTEHGTELFGTTYRRGEIVFRQGSPGHTLYIIQSGAVEVVQRKQGKDTAVAILEKGDFFGEMALFQNECRSATVTAISRTRLIPLTREILIERLRRDPNVSMHLLRKLIERIQRAHERYRQAFREKAAFRKAGASHDTQAQNDGVEVLDQGHEPLPETVHFSENLLISCSDEAMVDCRRRIDAGQTIFREGEPGQDMFLILSGSVGVSQSDASGSRLIDTIGPGDFFGEMALISQRPRSATVTALEPTHVVAIDEETFRESLHNRPELAVAVIKTMIHRLTTLEKVLSEPGCLRVHKRSAWVPALKKRDRLTLSIVSLSTCAGCSAVMLDRSVLSEMLSMTSLKYCQMLMDQEVLPESDVILVDGVVRLKEDEKRLGEARRKCKHLVAWGTCAAFVGIPGLANRFEVESVIEESYGSTDDAFSYYFSGSTGVDGSIAYQQSGIELQRRAWAIDGFVKVDRYLPGCPPAPSILLNLLRELTGRQPVKIAPIVCSDCGRRLKPRDAGTTPLSTDGTHDRICFNVMGKLCLGFMTRGGCDPPCPNNGVPCWGCRGPSKKAVAELRSGESLKEIAADGFKKRCPETENCLHSPVKRIAQTGHFMFDIGSDAVEKFSRVR